MIQINNVSFQYENADSGTLHDVSLQIGKGECVLLCGESGCGKTTVTRLINGLIPHYYEGKMSGDVQVMGLDVSKAELYETARTVGSVFQNPRSQFFCVDTTSEIAFGCENMGLSEDVVLERISEAVETLDATALLGRNIFHLSGGEKQKVACASVSAMHPDVFVLDEPTSNLDVEAIESLRRTLLLWKSQGKTIIIAEHRLYWLKDICDRVIYMQNGRIEMDISMREFMVFPPDKINALGLRTLHIEELFAGVTPFQTGSTLELSNYRFAYDSAPILDIPSLPLPVGGVIAVIGRNGAGKSTFSKCLCGLEKKFRGKSRYDGAEYTRKHMLKKCYMVMQDVNHQLFCESVDDEVRLGMDEGNEVDVVRVLQELGLSGLSERHPMSLSGGQKQRVAIASAMLAGKEILIFDEPTSGLDYKHMGQTAALLASLRGQKTVFIITHDPELIMRCCTHILHLEDGSVFQSYPLDKDGETQLKDFFTKSAKDSAQFEKAI